jgi:hypothetical protein
VIWCDHLVGPAAQLQPIRCEVDSGRPAGLSTTTRSVTVAIPRRRCLPPAFGIIRSRTGTGRKLRSRNAVRSRSRNSSTPSTACTQSALCPSTPAVLAPLPPRRRPPAHRYSPTPPGIPAAPLQTCWPPSPCTCLSHARTTTTPPPHPTAHSRRRTCTTTKPAGPVARATAGGSHVHRIIDRPDRRSATPRQPRHAYAIDLQVASPPSAAHGLGVDHQPQTAVTHCTPGPLSTRFEPAPVTRRQPLNSLALRTLASLAEPAPPGSTGMPRHCRGCFPPSSASPGSGCPSLNRHSGASWRTRQRSTATPPGSGDVQRGSHVVFEPQRG